MWPTPTTRGQARLALLSDLIAQGVAAGELNDIADPALMATCLREIMWAPIRNLVHISPQRIHQFHRQSVLSGLTPQPSGALHRAPQPHLGGVPRPGVLGHIAAAGLAAGSVYRLIGTKEVLLASIALAHSRATLIRGAACRGLAPSAS